MSLLSPAGGGGGVGATARITDATREVRCMICACMAAIDSGSPPVEEDEEDETPADDDDEAEVGGAASDASEERRLPAAAAEAAAAVADMNARMRKKRTKRTKGKGARADAGPLPSGR
jgi:hypothetical protein